MSYLDTQDDAELTPSQMDLVAALSVSQLEDIDRAILSNIDDNYRKVAYVVGKAMDDLVDKVSGIPAKFYSQRVANLVSVGALEARGNLKNMRYSEVKNKELS